MKQIKKILDKFSTSIKWRLLLMFGFLILFNSVVWLIIFFAHTHYALIFPLAALAFGLGLRHAVDPDHIAAIDNTTRKLLQEKKQPVAVGFFFSLGHSVIVIALSVLVASSAAFVQNKLPAWKTTGSIIGTLASALFLLIIGFTNLYFLRGTIGEWRKLKKLPAGETLPSPVRGPMTKLLMPLIKLVSSSWKMFFVGFLFGLGFDTATEVGLLGIAAVTAGGGVPIGYVLLLPLAFTGGMTLVDTLDGVFMLGAYGWANFAPAKKIYYNLYITGMSVIIALLIGGTELLQVISKQFHLHGKFWSLVNTTALNNLGYIIVIIFLASWLVAAAAYKYSKLRLPQTTN